MYVLPHLYHHASLTSVVAWTRGDCAIVVRMIPDFSKSALPLADGGYLEPGVETSQVSKWADIFDAANRILDVCIRGVGGPRPGWNTVASVNDPNSQQIVVGFWPRDSAMDESYGVKQKATPEATS